MSDSYIIGIGGGSCGGKSYVTDTIAKKALEYIDNDPIISKIHQDSYYKGGNENTNFDEPNSIDWDLMISHINELKNGKKINVPIYSFKTHTRLNETQEIYPSKVIIVEGTMILTNKTIVDLCNLKVFVSAYPELMYIRRLDRDVKERNRSIEEVNKRYFRDVKPGLILYIEPTMQNADIVIMNNSNNHDFVGLEILLDHIEKRLKHSLNH